MAVASSERDEKVDRISCIHEVRCVEKIRINLCGNSYYVISASCQISVVYEHNTKIGIWSRAWHATACMHKQYEVEVIALTKTHTIPQRGTQRLHDVCVDVLMDRSLIECNSHSTETLRSLKSDNNNTLRSIPYSSHGSFNLFAKRRLIQIINAQFFIWNVQRRLTFLGRNSIRCEQSRRRR
jgi:hypothetical protein